MNRRQKVILSILALIFFAPGVAAYFFYTHPMLLSSSKTNKGELLTPPISIREENTTSRSKWRLILWSSAACDSRCEEQLDKLARIRLALGRQLYDVVLELWLGDDSSRLSPALKTVLKDRDIQVSILPHHLREHSSVFHQKLTTFVANRQDFLILAYPPSQNSEDIFHDIKQLLRG